MAKQLVLFNPLADNGNGEERSKIIASLVPEGDEIRYEDITKITDVYEYIRSIPADDGIIIAGGDGTVNHFVNSLDNRDTGRSIYYLAAGTGNDFENDINGTEKGKLIKLDNYIKNLPTVTVNGKTTRFINGIGYGIDGYCCEAGDILRDKKPGSPVNYTSIAIKGLLFHFKPVNAKVTVDGRTECFRKVWLAPTMKGKFYGGGMMIAPGQDRNNADNTVTTVVLHNTGKLKTLIVFPSIFKGEHINHEEMFTIYSGKEVKVEFDRPVALQIDGETVRGVTSYTVKA